MFNSFSEMRLGQIWGKNRERALRLMKEGGWIVAGTVLTTLGQLVLVRVLTEYLDRTEYGKLALAMTAGTLVGQVIMGFQAGVGRFLPIALERKSLPEYQAAVQKLLAYAGVLVTFVTLLAGAVLNMWQGILFATAALAFCSGCNGVYNSLQTAARQRATVAFHTSLDAWLKIGLAVGAIHLLGAASTPVILGYTLSAFCTGISQCFCFRRFLDSQPTAAKFNPPSVWIKKIMSFSWPFSAWGMFTWMQQSSDRWALEKFTSTEIVGEYAVLLQLGYAPVAASTGILVTFLYPILYQRAGGGMNLENMGKANLLAWQTVWLVLGLTVLGFVLTLLTHPWIFEVLVGEEYRSVSYLLPWLVLAGGLFAAGQTFALQMMTEMATLRLLRVKIVTAILGAGANLAGAWLFGLAGVVGGIVAFSGLYLITIIFSMHKKTGLSSSPRTKQIIKKIIKIQWLVSTQLGLDPLRLGRSLRGLPRYFLDRQKYGKQYRGKLGWMPCLHDRYEEGGSIRSEYFWQDLLVARWIYEAAPEKHVDVGSRVDGFVAHVASFRQIEVLDIRPITTQIPGVTFRQADLMNAASLGDLFAQDGGYCDSLSCLHALEHFGLGRYGDPILPEGWRLGIKNLASLLKPKGTLYLSTPIGKPRVEFNAHRVFDPQEIVGEAEKRGLQPHRFFTISPKGQWEELGWEEKTFLRLMGQDYQLGIFIFRKIAVN